MKMMKKLPLAVAITTLLMSANAMADSWKVLQSTDLSNTSTASTLRQTGTTTSSYQALNNINFDTTDGTINTGSTQDVITGSSSLTLQQDTSTASSHQAANRATAHTITALKQTVTTGGNITLDQDEAGTLNVQALNDAEATNATSVITSLDQELTATAATTIQMNQGNAAATGNNNRQAVNRVQSDNIDALNQKITDDGTNVSLMMDQGKHVAGGIQAGNLIETTGSIASGVTQSITVKEAQLSQDSSDNSIQAANAVSLGDGSGTAGGEISQTFTPYKLSMVQTGANGSIQAGNYIGVALAAP